MSSDGRQMPVGNGLPHTRVVPYPADRSLVEVIDANDWTEIRRGHGRITRSEGTNR